MGTERTRAAGGGRPRPVQRARLRADYGGRHHERAGLTERTFFRHFADKREVLFGGSAMFQESFVAGIADAPDSATPMAAMAAALGAVAERFEAGRAHSRQRQNVIDANPVLQERELIKMASRAAAIAAALRQHGVPELSAVLTAEVGVAVFRVAFERWISGANDQTLPDIVCESLDELRAVFVS